jgi:hypothetical protein
VAETCHVARYTIKTPEIVLVVFWRKIPRLKHTIQSVLCSYYQTKYLHFDYNLLYHILVYSGLVQVTISLLPPPPLPPPVPKKLLDQSPNMAANITTHILLVCNTSFISATEGPGLVASTRASYSEVLEFELCPVTRNANSFSCFFPVPPIQIRPWRSSASLPNYFSQNKSNWDQRKSPAPLNTWWLLYKPPSLTFKNSACWLHLCVCKHLKTNSGYFPILH